MFSVSLATAAVVGGQTADSCRLLGSCFAFRDPTVFLTARHVVASKPAILRIASAHGELGKTAVMDVGETVEHPRADVAILRVDGPRRYVDTDPVLGSANVPSIAEWERMAFVDNAERPLPGTWYESYGFSTDMPTLLERAGVGEPRLFRGYVHRQMSFSGAGAAYRAIELSAGVPGGASGGPIYEWEPPHYVYAIATGSLESSVPVAPATESEGPTAGMTQVGAVHPAPWRVGIGLLLEPIRPWLDQHV